MKCYEQFLIYTKQIILTIITLIIYIDILSINIVAETEVKEIF